jgi:putative peptidoglycan lipid II flippase
LPDFQHVSLRSLAKATALIGIAQFAINGLQVIKLILSAALFGVTTGRLDVFFAALAIPSALQGVFVGSLQAAFIPRYVSLKAESEERANRLLGGTLFVTVALYLLVTLALWLGAEPLLSFALARPIDHLTPTDLLTLRLLVIAVVISGLCDILGSLANANHRFALPGFAPLLSIIVSILYLIFFYGQGPLALVYGLLLGNALQLVVMVFGAPAYGGFTPRFSSQLLHPDMTRLGRTMIPLALGAAFSNAVLIIDNMLAARLGPGSVSVYGQVFRLNEVVVKIVIAGLGTALLPYLSSALAAGNATQFRQLFNSSCRVAILLTGPLPLFLFLFGPALLGLVFQRGEFTRQDSLVVAHGWMIFSMALIPTAMTYFAGRALNALGMTRVILACSFLGLLVHTGAKLLLIPYLGLSGLLLGNLFGYLFYAWFYSWHLSKRLSGEEQLFGWEVWRVFAAPLAMMPMMLLLWWIFSPFITLSPGSISHQIWLTKATAVACSLAVLTVTYFFLSSALGIREGRLVQDAILSRLRRT